MSANQTTPTYFMVNSCPVPATNAVHAKRVAKLYYPGLGGYRSLTARPATVEEALWADAEFDDRRKRAAIGAQKKEAAERLAAKAPELRDALAQFVKLWDTRKWDTSMPAYATARALLASLEPMP